MLYRDSPEVVNYVTWFSNRILKTKDLYSIIKLIGAETSSGVEKHLKNLLEDTISEDRGEKGPR